MLTSSSVFPYALICIFSLSLLATCLSDLALSQRVPHGVPSGTSDLAPWLVFLVVLF